MVKGNMKQDNSNNYYKKRENMILNNNTISMVQREMYITSFIDQW